MAEFDDGYQAGQLGARQQEHDRRLASIETKMDEQGRKIDSLLESMAVAKGGYRALVSVGIISASVAGGVTELLRWIRK